MSAGAPALQVPAVRGMLSTTEQEIIEGLRALELDESASVIVHSSLRSFGHVEGGALAVCRALVAVCGTVLVTGRYRRPDGHPRSTGAGAAP